MKKKAARAREMAERARLEAEERRKVQEARNEAIRLNAEAEILENAEEGSEIYRKKFQRVKRGL